ncbi:hypothetical protein ACFL1H_02680 [Nanoarchaeota archaeon]
MREKKYNYNSYSIKTKKNINKNRIRDLLLFSIFILAILVIFLFFSFSYQKPIDCGTSNIDVGTASKCFIEKLNKCQLSKVKFTIENKQANVKWLLETKGKDQGSCTWKMQVIDVEVPELDQQLQEAIEQAETIEEKNKFIELSNRLEESLDELKIIETTCIYDGKLTVNEPLRNIDASNCDKDFLIDKLIEEKIEKALRQV